MNDMPVAYQSRAVTEPQREVARRSRDGGVAGTNYGNSFISPVGGAKSPQGDSLYAYPAGGYFSMKKSNQKSLGENPETPDAPVRPV